MNGDPREAKGKVSRMPGKGDRKESKGKAALLGLALRTGPNAPARANEATNHDAGRIQVGACCDGPGTADRRADNRLRGADCGNVPRYLGWAAIGHSVLQSRQSQ